MRDKDLVLYDIDTRVKELDFIQNVISRLSSRQQEYRLVLAQPLASTSTSQKILWRIFVW